MDKPYTPHITPGICRSGWKMVRIWPAFARPGSGCKGRQPSSSQKAAGDCGSQISLQDLPAVQGLYWDSNVCSEGIKFIIACNLHRHSVYYNQIMIFVGTSVVRKAGNMPERLICLSGFITAFRYLSAHL